jgi:hypothetical protein
MPALGGGPLPESAGYHHIAFACEDVFAAAMQMRSARLPTLSVAGNYYDDLAARTDLHRPRSTRCASSPSCTTPTTRAACTSTSSPRCSAAACSSSWCSAAGATTATAREHAVRTAAQYRQLVLAGVIG